ncbi:MAG: hypothetical protein AB9903_03290 [Vulcanimicrobiota bacterium]
MKPERQHLFWTDRSNVVYAPTGEDYSLLLSISDADGFISELKK